MTRIKVRVLKDLCRFETCSHIKYTFFEESVTFVHYSVQENRLCFSYFSREFDCRTETVCLQEKFCYFVSVCVPHCSDAPNDRFLSNASNRCFKLSGVLLKRCRLILGCVKKVLSERLFLENLDILEFIRAV